MDAVDAQLVAKAKGLFESREPGALARLEKLPGRYVATVPYRHTPARPARPARPAQHGQPARPAQPPQPRTLHLWIAYLVEHRRSVHVSMRAFYEETSPEQWNRYEYCYHFGANPMAADDDVGKDTYFRVCRDAMDHHFHLQHYSHAGSRGHIPPWMANPPLSDDAAWFVEVLEHFVKHDVLPIEVRP